MKLVFASIALALLAVLPAGSNAQAAMSSVLHAPAATDNLLIQAGSRHYGYRGHYGYGHRHRYYGGHGHYYRAYRHDYYGGYYGYSPGVTLGFSFGTPYYGYPYYSGAYYNYRPYYRTYVAPRVYYTRRPSRGGSCDYWARKCAQNWGGGANWRGCMRYHGCN